MRVKKTLTSPVDRTGAEEAFAKYSESDAKEKEILAKMDVEITAIRSGYQKELTELQTIKATAFENLQNYAENNRDDFGKLKSIEFSHGTLGFRTGTPALKTMKGFTWASVLTLLKLRLPQYVRNKEEPAKDKILADRETPLLKKNLEKIGLYVDQDETFFVEPKKEVETSI